MDDSDEIVYSDELINELGTTSPEKRRASALHFAAEQLGGADNDGDDWDDTLALRSFLKLPKEAKRRLSTTGSNSIYGEDRAYLGEEEEGGHKPETAIKMLTKQHDLDGAALDGTPWFADDSPSDVKRLMEKSDHAGTTSGSLAIDLYANSAMTTAFVEVEGKEESSGLHDHDEETSNEIAYNDATAQDHDTDSILSEVELESFGNHNSKFLRRMTAPDLHVSGIAQADFIAQRALLKKVAKEQVNIAEELEKKRQEVNEQLRFHTIRGVIRTIRGYRSRLRSEGLHQGWRQWRLFCDSFDHVRSGFLEGKFMMAAQALQRQKRKRHFRGWIQVVHQGQHCRSFFVTQLDKLSTRILRDALISWKTNVNEMRASKTEFNYVVVSLRKRLQKMKGTNTDLRWALARWALIVRDYRYRDATMEKALYILARKASFESWALRLWRKKLINYPVDRRVNMEQAALSLELVMSKHQVLQIRQKLLRCFRIWASKVAQYNSIHLHTYTVLTSLSASAVRRILHSRLLHWNRTVRLMLFKATRLCSVIKLAALAQRRLLQQKALTHWAQTALFQYKIDQGLRRIEAQGEYLRKTREKASMFLSARKEDFADSYALITAFTSWKRRNVRISRLRARRSMVLSLLRRTRLQESRKALALYKWKSVMLATELKVRTLNNIPVLLYKQYMRILWGRWRRQTRRLRALGTMGRWLVNSRKIYRIVDMRVCFFRWRTQIRKEEHAEGVLTKFFSRIPFVVYRLTLRRWATRVSRMKQFRARKDALYIPFDHWCGYVRYWQATKARLRYTISMSQKGALQYAIQVWTKRTKTKRSIHHGFMRCMELRRDVITLFLRKSFSYWRKLNAGHRAASLLQLGNTVSLALRRVITAEDEREQTTLQNSMLCTRIETLQEYQAFLLGGKGPAITIADRGIDKARAHVTFAAWRRFCLNRKLHLNVVRSLLRNRRRVQVLHILSRRFRRWKHLTEFSHGGQRHSVEIARLEGNEDNSSKNEGRDNV